MDVSKIGMFIKKLRIDKGMSQYELADLIPIDRSVVSKWERGEVLAPIDKMRRICEIFDISINELISGELETKENEKEHQNNLFDYLIKQDSKNRKLKMISIILFFITLILTFAFLAYYFIETHNTEKTYRVTGISSSYEINNGFLFITRENSYLKIGSILDKNSVKSNTYEITLYYKKGEVKEEIYTGSSDLVLKDLHGYNASLNNYNFDDIKNNLYIELNGEEIKLELSTDYNNDNYLLDSWIYVVKDKHNGNNKLDIDEEKIKKEFKCNNELCIKELSNYMIQYSSVGNSIYVKEDNITVEYDNNTNRFIYISKKLNFDITNDKLNCTSPSCENYREIYDKYYTNIIKNYLK